MKSNPYYKPMDAWSKSGGNDLYQRVTHCPYCGTAGRNVIKRYEGAWFRLTCRECGLDYKVRNVIS